MKKIKILLLLFLSANIFSQEVNEKIKNEIVTNIILVNKYYNDKNELENIKLKKYFTEVIFCPNCENKVEDLLNPQIENSNFLKNNLKEVIGLLKITKIKKSKISFDAQSNTYHLSYSTAEPNKETGFEGASALIYINKVNGIFKISGLMTIP